MISWVVVEGEGLATIGKCTARHESSERHDDDVYANTLPDTRAPSDMTTMYMPIPTCNSHLANTPLSATYRKNAEIALEVCREMGIMHSSDVVAHSLGCKIATIMREQGFGGDDCKCVYVSPNNQELDGSLDYVLGVLRKLGGSERAQEVERALGSLKMLLRGVGGKFFKFNPNREEFWNILRRVFRKNKGNLKMVSLEGEGEEGLDEAFEWVMEIGKEASEEEKLSLEGVVDLDVQVGGDGTIVVASSSKSSEEEGKSATSISVDILDFPHLSPCYFDLASQFNRASATGFENNFGKVGKLEMVEEIASLVSEFINHQV